MRYLTEHKCRWKQDDNGYWVTECCEKVSLEVNDPKSLKFIWCPFLWGEIKAEGEKGGVMDSKEYKQGFFDGAKEQDEKWQERLKKLPEYKEYVKPNGLTKNLITNFKSEGFNDCRTQVEQILKGGA